MAELEMLAKLLLLALVWGVFSSPFLAAAFFAARRIRRGGSASPALAVSLGAITALMVAPIPTPIITILQPHAFVLFSEGYYAAVIARSGPDAWLAPWVFKSLAATGAICIVVSLHFLSRKPGPSTGPCREA